jgi:hypothetical protein
MSAKRTLTIDCAQAVVLAAFWRVALGYAEAPLPEGFGSWQGMSKAGSTSAVPRTARSGPRTCRHSSPGCSPTTAAAPAPAATRSRHAAAHRPVLADVSAAFPGRPVPPWPAAVPAEPFEVPSRRGVTRLASDTTTGRCAYCGRSFRRRLNGNLIAQTPVAATARAEGSRPQTTSCSRAGCRCCPA